MSQLGYMFIAVGLGFYSSGLFHVFTHAFFKAMLFMGAGAAILALHHEQNIFKMAQHRVYQPIVKATFLIGVIAIAGIPPFSGFFSKDAILAAAFQEGEFIIYGIGIFTAFLTAFYMFRLYFVVFVAPNGHDVHYASTDKTISFPLLVLAIGAVFAGFLNFPAIFGGEHQVDTWLAQLGSTALHMSHSTEYLLMFASVAVAALGILVAYKKYARFDVSKPETEEGIIGNKFYIDELYDYVFVKSLKKISHFFDRVVDDKVVDGMIMLVCREFVDFGKKLAFLQNGNVRFYALYMLIGMSCAFLYLYTTLIGQ
jgi:NADH-quinone oxidoreductase subunit L